MACAPRKSSMPSTVFISYSHKDRGWLKKIQASMGDGFFKNNFELWSDDRIETNDEWRKEILGEIANARVALLLVSNGFLGSKFIATKELPKILNYRKAGRLKIVWVPVNDIAENLLKSTGLGPIQSAWPPGNPLSKLRGKKLDDALIYIGSLLTNATGLHDDTDDIRPKIAKLIPDDTDLGDSFAAGDYSMFYRATMLDAEVAVKALVSTPNKPWLREDFVKRANIVKKITNSTAIEIRHVIADARLPCVVMDFLSIPTLKSRLEKEGKLSGQLVANALGQLARLAADLHGMAGQPLIGPVRPSHIHYDAAKGKAFISLLSIANETLESCRNFPTRLQDAQALAYLSPERFYGKPISDKTDQYYLALLALELLQGKPPVSIENFADLELKSDFFKSPRSKFDEWFRLNEPALSFVLAKMLEPEPEDRWDETGKLVAALQDIAKGRVPDEVRKHADNQYTNELRKNASFFRSFYRILFAKSGEIEALFRLRASSIEAQAQKLDKAMSNILNFTQGLLTSSLSDAVDSHRGMGIKADHFGIFQEAFIDALAEVNVTDGYSQDAWRAILGPALAHMKNQIDSPAA